MKKLAVCATSLAITLIAATPALAGSFADWNDHAGGLGFLFGNQFDTHQQSRVGQHGQLAGLLYIHFNGITTADGLRVASHADCNAVPDCTVGWTMTGKPREAQFLYHAMPDHPVFLIERSQIPQPGAYTHFHRVGQDVHSSGTGYLLQLFAVTRFCFIHMGADAASPDRTCEDNGGVSVQPGLDAATHLNIVTSAPAGM